MDVIGGGATDVVDQAQPGLIKAMAPKIEIKVEKPEDDLTEQWTGLKTNYGKLTPIVGGKDDKPKPPQSMKKAFNFKSDEIEWMLLNNLDQIFESNGLQYITSDKNAINPPKTNELGMPHDMEFDRNFVAPQGQIPTL
jgi:hypothetical protein